MTSGSVDRVTETHTQLAFDGSETIVRAPVAPVLAYNPAHHTNAQRVLDLARLGYLPEPVLDPTCGRDLGMWRRHRPHFIVLGDMHPEKARQVRLDFMRLPFRDRSFASCLFDPPYKYHGTSSDRDMEDRFGVDQPHTVDEIDAFLRDGSRECARVTREFLIVKCQDQVVGGKKRWQTRIVEAALALDGWDLRDELHLENHSGLGQQDRTQRHVRGNYSTFLVFQPGRG